MQAQTSKSRSISTKSISYSTRASVNQKNTSSNSQAQPPGTAPAQVQTQIKSAQPLGIPRTQVQAKAKSAQTLGIAQTQVQAIILQSCTISSGTIWPAMPCPGSERTRLPFEAFHLFCCQLLFKTVFFGGIKLYPQKVFCLEEVSLRL